jgi:hypothetical protein
LHDGTITENSEGEDEGATFRALLPLHGFD